MTTTETQYNTSLDGIADPIQMMIFSHLSIFELIQNINILSKQHNFMVSKDAIIWKQIGIKSLGIMGGRNYKTNDYNSFIWIGHIQIDGHIFKNPPSHFLSKLSLIPPLNLNQISITPGIKPWCQYIAHQKCMRFISDILTKHLSIQKVRKVIFWSVADRICDRDKDKMKYTKCGIISMTELFGQILDICNAEILDTKCAIVPQVIPIKCVDNIKELYVAPRRNKHYDMNDLCNILQQLKKLETVHIGELCRYDPNEEKLSSIPWPDTLINIYWGFTPIRIGSIWNQQKKTDQEKQREKELMDFFEQDVRSKCPNLKVFEKENVYN